MPSGLKYISERQTRYDNRCLQQKYEQQKVDRTLRSLRRNTNLHVNMSDNNVIVEDVGDEINKMMKTKKSKEPVRRSTRQMNTLETIVSYFK